MLGYFQNKQPESSNSITTKETEQDDQSASSDAAVAVVNPADFKHLCREMDVVMAMLEAIQETVNELRQDRAAVQTEKHMIRKDLKDARQELEDMREKLQTVMLKTTVLEHDNQRLRSSLKRVTLVVAATTSAEDQKKIMKKSKSFKNSKSSGFMATSTTSEEDNDKSSSKPQQKASRRESMSKSLSVPKLAIEATKPEKSKRASCTTSASMRTTRSSATDFCFANSSKKQNASVRDRRTCMSKQKSSPLLVVPEAPAGKNATTTGAESDLMKRMSGIGSGAAPAATTADTSPPSSRATSTSPVPSRGMGRALSSPALCQLVNKPILGPYSASLVFKFQARDNALERFLTTLSSTGASAENADFFPRGEYSIREVDDEALACFSNRIYVPDKLRRRILSHYLSSSAKKEDENGDDGEWSKRCIWPGMQGDIDAFVAARKDEATAES